MHDLVDKTLSFVFGHVAFKTIGSSRTDAKVSAQHYPVQLFISEVIDAEFFIHTFNQNASNDLMAVSIVPCATNFAIINAAKMKTYHYYFSFGEKQHPFVAPLVMNFPESLDLGLMQTAAKLFEGKHFFNKYCAKPSEKTQFERTIAYCAIEENTYLQSNFLQANTYVLVVKGKGFLRYQIRYMMATLLEIGRGNMQIEEFLSSLQSSNDGNSWRHIAPSSGLQLVDVQLAIE